MIQIETIEYMKQMAKLADYFVGSSLVGAFTAQDTATHGGAVTGAEQNRHGHGWSEFVSIQKTLNALGKLEKRVKRRINSTGGLQLARRPSSSNFSAADRQHSDVQAQKRMKIE